MAKCSRYIIAIFLIHISAVAWAGSIVDIPVGDTGWVRYGLHGRSVLEGGGIAITELIYGTKTLDTFAKLSFGTARGLGQSGDSLLYGPGGSIVITGCIERAGQQGHGCRKGDFRGVLMRATFLNAKLVDDNGKLMLIAQFVERLNPALAAMLGVPDQSLGSMDLLLSNLTSHAWAVDKVDAGSLNILSEPSSLATLGSSLLGLLLAFGARLDHSRGQSRSRGLNRIGGNLLGTKEPVYCSGDKLSAAKSLPEFERPQK
jgi:hypothetical protein